MWLTLLELNNSLSEGGGAAAGGVAGVFSDADEASDVLEDSLTVCFTDSLRIVTRGR